MGLFRKRKMRITQQASGSLLAEKIASVILTRQRKWADYLNAKASRTSFKSRLIALIAFCLVSASYLTYLLICSIL